MNMEIQLLLEKIRKLTELVDHYRKHHVPCEECSLQAKKS